MLEKWESIASGELPQKQKALLGSKIGPQLPHFKTIQMQKARFCDLRFRLGAGYLYCHQVIFLFQFVLFSVAQRSCSILIQINVSLINTSPRKSKINTMSIHIVPVIHQVYPTINRERYLLFQQLSLCLNPYLVVSAI